MSDKWRRAKSLVVLGDEIEAKYPGTTVWDIGDANHASRWSDHNPNECCDVVCAIDVKGDGGMSLAAFVMHLIKYPHPNLRYVIHNRTIYQRHNGFAAEDYTGSSPHTEHAHVSVGNGPDGRSTGGYDSAEPWGIADLGTAHPSKPTTPEHDWTEDIIMTLPTLKQGSTKTGDNKRAQSLLAANGFPPAHTFDAKGRPDGKFGAGTDAQTRAYQRAKGLAVDGLIGPRTWRKLLGE